MTPEEYKETMKTLAGDENLLPGIYNFCDLPGAHFHQFPKCREIRLLSVFCLYSVIYVSFAANSEHKNPYYP